MGSPPSLLLQKPYMPVSQPTAPQSLSSCHEHHSVEKLVLTWDMLVQMVLPCGVTPQILHVFGHGNVDGEYSCYSGCLFHRDREVYDDRPQEYHHPAIAVH